MFWDNVAWAYDFFVNVINGKTHSKLRKIIAEQIEADDEVLECACGTGFLSEVIAPLCHSLTATDFSEKMLEKARKNTVIYNNVTFAKVDITSLDYQDESFNKVVAANVIHLLDNPARAVGELYRVCRPGGKVIIPTYINKNAAEKTTALSKTIDAAGADFKREFTYDSYRGFFAELGYEDVEFSLAPGRIPCAVAVIKK
ncbi:MAG: class I SAM-dependent methyltransferase [Eubacterium sp.]|nr:class I SAM-dependent methyltransferase [Eubacterium sp.]